MSATSDGSAASVTSPASPGSGELPPGTVEVVDVWESFKIYHERAYGVRDRLFARRKTVSEDFLALKGVTLHLDPGDTVGLIGENGSGKSTLLKCIANILEPTKGVVRTHGRIASMLEVGAGFHGDLTGRENVFLNGSILGFSRSFVLEVFDEIVAFAGPQVAEAIDNPVRTFSSGMYLRLGFAVSVHLQPDILIVDEVLAVGDAPFQKQCFDRIHELKRRGVTICVVSHDLDTVSSLCDRGVYLKHGEVVMDGPSIEVVDRYRSDYTSDQPGGSVQGWSGGEVYGNGDMTLHDIELVTERSGDGGENKNVNKNEGEGEGEGDGEGEDEDEHITTGDRIAVQFRVKANSRVEHPTFGLILRANDGTYLYDTNTLWRRQETGVFEQGSVAVVRVDLDVNLLPGRYVVTVAASRNDGKQVYDWHTDAVGFDVVGDFIANGLVELGGAITVRASLDNQVEETHADP